MLCAGKEYNMSASLIIKGNAIFDGTGSNPFAGAVVIEGNRIKAIVKDGNTAEFEGPETKVLEYQDKLILPGFNDCHTHITSGAFLDDENFCINVLEAPSREAAVSMLKEYGNAHPDNEWVFGIMMNNLAWEDQTLPDRYDLDAAIPDRPAAFQLADMHTMIANTLAMEKAGYTNDTPSPDDGIVEKDENGVLTGRFFDGGSFRLSGAIYEGDDEMYLQVYRRFFKKLSALGITATGLVSPYGVDVDPIRLFEIMEEEGSLTTRICFYPNLGDYDKDSYDALYAKHHDGKLRLKGLKQLLDGVTSVFTAFLLEPYTNDPTTCGTTSVEPQVFHDQLMKAVADGRNVRVHTIGDGAIRMALDYFQEAEEKYGKQNLRHVMEHLENVDPADMGRFAELGISAGMQPVAMLFDLEGDDKEAAIGYERCKHAWPLRELLDTGMVMGLGSDYPCFELDPMHEVYAAIERRTFSGKPQGGWFPEQKITLNEALKAYGWGAAYVVDSEDDFGTLEEGMLADLVVMDRDLFKVDPIDIIDAQVELTVFDGEIVYQK